MNFCSLCRIANPGSDDVCLFCHRFALHPRQPITLASITSAFGAFSHAPSDQTAWKQQRARANVILAYHCDKRLFRRSLPPMNCSSGSRGTSEYVDQVSLAIHLHPAEQTVVVVVHGRS